MSRQPSAGDLNCHRPGDPPLPSQTALRRRRRARLRSLQRLGPADRRPSGDGAQPRPARTLPAAPLRPDQLNLNTRRRGAPALPGPAARVAGG